MTTEAAELRPCAPHGRPDAFHGEWNYSSCPASGSSVTEPVVS